MRQGPHQGAQKSTSAGSGLCSTTAAKLCSPASVIQGSGLLQFPQWGTPGAAVCTRFLLPQLWQAMIESWFVRFTPVLLVCDQPAADSSLSAGVGTPTLDGFGIVGGGIHTPEEYAEVESVVPRLYLLSRMIMELAANK